MMAHGFNQFPIEPEMERIPGKLRQFLFMERAPSNDEQTWEYFAYGYSAAFQVLAREALQFWPRKEYLRLPIFFLCRHSLEPALKEAIKEYSSYTTIEADLEGHKIHDLGKQLLQHMAAVGYPVDDEWTVYCDKLVKHLHNFDPNGERLRYPADKGGAVFGYTRVELKELVKAQEHVFTYCDAVISMLRDSAP